MANQQRGGSNQKIAPPIVEDGTVRRVLQNTENLFNQELVDRVFEDQSVVGAKLGNPFQVVINGNTIEIIITNPNDSTVWVLGMDIGGFYIRYDTDNQIRVTPDGELIVAGDVTPNGDPS